MRENKPKSRLTSNCGTLAVGTQYGSCKGLDIGRHTAMEAGDGNQARTHRCTVEVLAAGEPGDAVQCALPVSHRHAHGSEGQ